MAIAPSRVEEHHGNVHTIIGELARKVTSALADEWLGGHREPNEVLNASVWVGRIITEHLEAHGFVRIERLDTER